MDNIVNSFVTLAAANTGGYSSIILIVLMIALMYFFMIRPQQKQRKQHQEMMNELHKGDEVVTIGRLHGKIDEVNKENQTVTLDCEGIYLTFDMVAIAGSSSGLVKLNSLLNKRLKPRPVLAKMTLLKQRLLMTLRMLSLLTTTRSQNNN